MINGLLFVFIFFLCSALRRETRRTFHYSKIMAERQKVNKVNGESPGVFVQRQRLLTREVVDAYLYVGTAVDGERAAVGLALMCLVGSSLMAVSRPNT